jgi:hypothetical protein
MLMITPGRRHPLTCLAAEECSAQIDILDFVPLGIGGLGQDRWRIHPTQMSIRPNVASASAASFADRQIRPCLCEAPSDRRTDATPTTSNHRHPTAQ